MIWGRKSDTAIPDVALDDLVALLAPTSIETSLEGNTLRARHEFYTVIVEVLPPTAEGNHDEEIKAIVRLTTKLPEQFSDVCKTPGFVAGANKFAALGSILYVSGSAYVGSRLTIYKSEDAWKTLHLPLLLFTIISGAEPQLGAMRREISGETGRDENSVWIEDDFKEVERHLSNLCVCSNGGLGFTAELGLSVGSSSAIAGDLDTALFKLIGDQPHPEMGGGLFSLLEMPYLFEDSHKLHNACAHLNKLEMAPRDLVPHFGAWCVGSLGNNPAYVSFLPNALHQASGIAVNQAIWGLNRAQWADEILGSNFVDDKGGARRRGSSDSSARSASRKKPIEEAMHNIEMHEPTPEFAECWQAAGRHLQSRMQGASQNWLKADLTPPFLEHLSFRMGNQLFYVRIFDIEGRVQGPGNKNGYRTIAQQCKGHACLMPMRRVGGTWTPDEDGWGLINPDTHELVDPVELISDENIEMTDWELHDFAVQAVRDHITQKLGFKLMSSQGNPGVDPSIWFVGPQGPEWVVVRAARYPRLETPMPVNIKKIAENCARTSPIGHFASVGFANDEDAFDSSGQVPALPLWRGHGTFIRFQGLAPVTVQ